MCFVFSSDLMTIQQNMDQTLGSFRPKRGITLKQAPVRTLAPDKQGF